MRQNENKMVGCKTSNVKDAPFNLPVAVDWDHFTRWSCLGLNQEASNFILDSKMFISHAHSRWLRFSKVYGACCAMLLVIPATAVFFKLNMI